MEGQRMSQILDEQNIVERMQIPFGSVLLEGVLGVPKNPCGVAILVHGHNEGSTQHVNRTLARLLREMDIASLLLDLGAQPGKKGLDAVADRSLHVQMSAERLIGVTEWLKRNPKTQDLPVGYIGSGHEAAIALVAAAERHELTRAVVSHSGRLDAVQSVLPRVLTPTLFIVGAYDLPTAQQNHAAMVQIGAEHKKLEIIPGANHLFDGPGTLAASATAAANWLVQHLCSLDFAIVNQRKTNEAWERSWSM